MSSPVYINIVTYNSRKFLDGCLKSIFNQNFKDFKVLVIDNASSDGSVFFIKEKYPQVEVIENRENIGFAEAHNQGIREAIKNGTKFVLVTNPDIVMENDFLEQAVREIENDKTVGSLGGKLLKIKKNKNLKKEEKSDIIDTTGLRVSKNRRFADRGAGEKDLGQYDSREEVFGVSGALALYSTEALEDIKINGEYFDKDFFAYKEDVDLAWRLRLYGWKSLYLPEARAFHYRGAYGAEKSGSIEILKNRKGKSKFVNYHSYKNHLFTLLKNEQLSNFFIHLPFIVFYELKKFVYLLFFDRDALKSLKEFFSKYKKMKDKRKIILSGAKHKPKEIRRWFN